MKRLAAFYQRNERAILGLAMAATILIAWEGLARGWFFGVQIKPIFISSPTAVAVAFWRMYFQTGEIWPHLGLSAFELVCGLGLAIIVGIPFGLLCGRYQLMGRAFAPVMIAINATPQVAFIPLLILWLGTGLATRIFIIFLLTLLPLFMAANAAVRTLDARLFKVATSFGSSEPFLFRSVIVPGSVPFLLTGLRLAIGRSMIGIVVGELYGSATGLGLMINRAGSTFKTDIVFVGVFTIVVAGLALTEIVRRIEGQVEVWRPNARGAGN